MVYRMYEFWTEMHLFDRETGRQADRETDGRTQFSSLDRICIACSAVKNVMRIHYEKE